MLATGQMSNSAITLAGYQAERLCAVIGNPQNGATLPLLGRDLALNVLCVSAAQSLVVAHNVWAAVVAAREPGRV